MEILSQLKTIDTTRGTTGRKTWIMKEFGKKYYEISAYISMDGNERMKEIFGKRLILTELSKYW